MAQKNLGRNSEVFLLLQVPGQAVQVHGQAAQVPGVNGASSGCQRCRFRVSTVQVPKQGLNLHRESAFCVAPVAQVSALKWNLCLLRLDLHHLRLNLRHRGASGLFRNSPADVRTSVAAALTRLIINTLE